MLGLQARSSMRYQFLINLMINFVPASLRSAGTRRPA